MSKITAMLLVLTSVLALYTIQPAVAQDTGKRTKPGASAHWRLHRWNALAKWLQLSDEQKAKIRSILSNARERAQKVRADTSLTPAQKRQQLRDLRRSTRQEIGSVLTPEQREKLRKLWAWRWRQWHMWRKHRWGAPDNWWWNRWGRQF